MGRAAGSAVGSTLWLLVTFVLVAALVGWLMLGLLQFNWSDWTFGQPEEQGAPASVRVA
ncbi:MAG: hypothetical protein M3N51_11875 [Actinomycetota bacterium]|nr:hypothetical protein [Actinomycetota bacterium]